MLGLRFSRLVHAAIASGALVLGACPDGGGQDTDADTDTTTATSTSEPTTTTVPLPPQPPPPPPQGDITPPALVSAELLGPATLQLSFTEPVAPVDTVNPKRFRLSFARGYDGGNYGGEPATYLIDPRYYNLVENCPPPPPSCYDEPQPYYCYYGPYCYYQQSDPILVADLFNHDTDPNSLILELTTPILPTLCSTIANFEQSTNHTAVLHLHYADGGQAQVTDLADLPLPALGEPWVKYSGSFYNYPGPDLFATLSPFVPIPCPF